MRTEEKKPYGQLLYDLQVMQIIRIDQIKENIKELENEFEENKKELDDELEEARNDLEETQSELRAWNKKVKEVNN